MCSYTIISIINQILLPWTWTAYLRISQSFKEEKRIYWTTCFQNNPFTNSNIQIIGSSTIFSTFSYLSVLALIYFFLNIIPSNSLVSIVIWLCWEYNSSPNDNQNSTDDGGWKTTFFSFYTWVSPKFCAILVMWGLIHQSQKVMSHTELGHVKFAWYWVVLIRFISMPQNPQF